MRKENQSDEINKIFRLIVRDTMILFIKGFIIGVAKIIPGVSGALLAINFDVYEKAIFSIVNFFSDWKNNLLFLLKLSSGILFSIVLCSGIIVYLLDKYSFILMMFFTGLIFGGTYNFFMKIKCQKRDYFLIFIIVLFLLIISYLNVFNNQSFISNESFNLLFFFGGIIEVITSLIPGISGTALLMILDIYDTVLLMISNIFDFRYVLLNINLYISYGLGMLVSFVITIYGINYFLRRYPIITNKIILGLCIYSIILLFKIAFSFSFNIISFILGVMSLIIGLLLGCILDK